MKHEYIESQLKFEFLTENWTTIKYDDNQDYLKVSNSLQGTKAIDFLGFYNENSLVLFEIKSFRGFGYQDSTERRIANGMEELSTEIAQKVRDTVAVIAGLSRNSQEISDSLWNKSAKHILMKNKQLIIIAWIEEDANKRTKNEMSVRISKLKNKLSWLTNDIFIENVKYQHSSFEGLTISSLR